MIAIHNRNPNSDVALTEEELTALKEKQVSLVYFHDVLAQQQGELRSIEHQRIKADVSEPGSPREAALAECARRNAEVSAQVKESEAAVFRLGEEAWAIVSHAGARDYDIANSYLESRLQELLGPVFFRQNYPMETKVFPHNKLLDYVQTRLKAGADLYTFQRSATALEMVPRFISAIDRVLELEAPAHTERAAAEEERRQEAANLAGLVANSERWLEIGGEEGVAELKGAAEQGRATEARLAEVLATHEAERNVEAERVAELERLAVIGRQVESQTKDEALPALAPVAPMPPVGDPTNA